MLLLEKFDNLSDNVVDLIKVRNIIFSLSKIWIETLFDSVFFEDCTSCIQRLELLHGVHIQDWTSRTSTFRCLDGRIAPGVFRPSPSFRISFTALLCATPENSMNYILAASKVLWCYEKDSSSYYITLSPSIEMYTCGQLYDKRKGRD